VFTESRHMIPSQGRWIRPRPSEKPAASILMVWDLYLNK
jgi:hypothetical protein